MTDLEVFKRASALVLQMEATARGVCTALGNSKLQEPDGKGSLLTVSQESIAPDGMDTVNRDAVRFAHFRKPTQTMGENLVEFDSFRRKVESRMQPGGFAARLCFRNASLSRLDESLVPASADGQSGAAGIAQQVRHLFGPMGGGGK